MMTTVALEEPGSTRDSFSGSTLGLTEKRNNNDMSDNKCVIAVVVAVALVSVVALVLAAVALTNSEKSVINVNSGSPGSTASNSNGGTGGGGPTGQKRMFTIAVGHDWGAHNYLDKEGYMTGFTKEVIAEVCSAAGIDCKTVWDKWSNCWVSTAGQHGAGGPGLMGRWYDACSGWAVTVDRTQVFDFGASYLKPYADKFFVKPGATFDPKDLTNKKIGFLNGFATDEKCIARQKDITGNELKVDQVKHYDNIPDAVAGVLAGEVDAIATDTQSMTEYVKDNRIEAKGDFNCILGGTTIMTRKDSDLVRYWNDGFQKIKSSGKFSRMCKEAQEKHGSKGDITCL